MAVELVRTEHVLCPDCNTTTYGPYLDPQFGYFDGHYCEDCGLTWRWDKMSSKMVGTFC